MERNINSTEFFAPLYGSLTLQTFCCMQVLVLLAFANQNAGFFQNGFWKANTYRNHLATEHNQAAFGRLLFSFHVLLFVYLLKFSVFALFQLGTEYYWEVSKLCILLLFYSASHHPQRTHTCLYAHPYIKHRHCVTYDLKHFEILEKTKECSIGKENTDWIYFLLAAEVCFLCSTYSHLLYFRCLKYRDYLSLDKAHSALQRIKTQQVLTAAGYKRSPLRYTSI